MPNDPTLGRTYQAEIDLDDLKYLRQHAAVSLTSAGLELWRAIRAKRPSKTIQSLRAEMHSCRADYECACAAVEALEKYHFDARILQEVKDFMAGAEEDRRTESRYGKYAPATELGFLKDIARELRAIRDKVDPPAPSGSDFEILRRKLNALHDEPS